MYCRKCGKQVDDNSSFCPYCGESFDVPVQNQYVQLTPEEFEALTKNNVPGKPKKKLGKILLVIFLILFGLYCLGNSDSEDSTVGDDAPIQTQAATTDDKDELHEEKTAYTDFVEEQAEPTNQTTNPRLLNCVEYGVEPQKVADEAEIPESELYAPVEQFNPNTVLPDIWNGVDYELSYSGLFARYCELAFVGGGDPTLYYFSYGDLNRDGRYEVIINRPDEETASVNWDVYTLSALPNNGLYYPEYVGTIYGLTNPVFYTAYTGYDDELFVYDWTSEDNVTVTRYLMETDEYGNHSFTKTKDVYSGSSLGTELGDAVGDYFRIEMNNYNMIADGIYYPVQ